MKKKRVRRVAEPFGREKKKVIKVVAIAENCQKEEKAK
jgi:hypothetical protein